MWRLGRAALPVAMLAAAGAGWGQTGPPMPHGPGVVPGAAGVPFYREWTFHVLIGLGAGTAGFLAHRAWVRRRWRPVPAGMVTEAVLVVDLVGSTDLATRHGDGVAMRARHALTQRTLAAARAAGVQFVESTGDGCLLTFPSVEAAIRAARALFRDLRAAPPDVGSGSPLEIRAGVTYGEILLDARGLRHGAPINKAFRLLGLSADGFVAVAGEPRLADIPDRNRLFLDEEAASQLAGSGVMVRPVGVCHLKGFPGFHRVCDVPEVGA